MTNCGRGHTVTRQLGRIGKVLGVGVLFTGGSLAGWHLAAWHELTLRAESFLPSTTAVRELHLELPLIVAVGPAAAEAEPMPDRAPRPTDTEETTLASVDVPQPTDATVALALDLLPDDQLEQSAENAPADAEPLEAAAPVAELAPVEPALAYMAVLDPRDRSILAPSGIVETDVIGAAGPAPTMPAPQRRQSLAASIAGPVHVVAPGETLSGIAIAYRVQPDSLTAANDLESDLIRPGQSLRIPGGTIPARASTPAGAAPTSTPIARPTPPPTATPAPTARPTSAPSAQPAATRMPAPTAPPVVAQAPVTTSMGTLVWPLNGTITQQFGDNGHTGLDIAAPQGASIRAVAAGTVVVAAKLSTGYGWRIIIDHGGGYSSLYSHLSAFSVAEGQRVAGGQVVGAVGKSGVATGPHLHLEIRVKGQAVNPLKYLP